MKNNQETPVEAEDAPDESNAGKRPKGSKTALLIGGAVVLLFGGGIALKSKDKGSDLEPKATVTEPTIFSEDYVTAAKTSIFVADLNMDGVFVKPLGEKGAYFDLNGNGIRVATELPGSEDALFLVSDPGGLGFWVLSEGSIGTGLKAFDENVDGMLNQSDGGFSDLMIWRDQNDDGLVQEDEFGALPDWGIVGIVLSESVGQDVAHSTLFFQDGSSVDIKELFPRIRPSDTVQDAPRFASSDILSVPDIEAQGLIHRTSVKAAQSPHFFDIAKDLMSKLEVGDVLGFYRGLSPYLEALSGYDRKAEILMASHGANANDYSDGLPDLTPKIVAAGYETLKVKYAREFITQSIQMYTPTMEKRMFSPHVLSWVAQSNQNDGLEVPQKILVGKSQESVQLRHMSMDDAAALTYIFLPNVSLDYGPEFSAKVKKLISAQFSGFDPTGAILLIQE